MRESIPKASCMIHAQKGKSWRMIRSWFEIAEEQWHVLTTGHQITDQAPLDRNHLLKLVVEQIPSLRDTISLCFIGKKPSGSVDRTHGRFIAESVLNWRNHRQGLRVFLREDMKRLKITTKLDHLSWRKSRTLKYSFATISFQSS